LNPEDLHYRPVDSFVDKKWWPYINFIGYMDSLSADSKQLFKNIKPSVDVRIEQAGLTGVQNVVVIMMTTKNSFKTEIVATRRVLESTCSSTALSSLRSL